MTTTRFRISPLLSAIGRVPVLLAVTIVLTTKPAGVTGLATAPTSSTNTVGMPPPLRLKQLLEAEMEGTRSTTSSGNGNEDESSSPILLPCCYDGLTARLIARAGFEATFMTGFGVSAVHGVPDTQLLSYGEMHQHATIIAEALASVALEAKGTGSNTNGLPIPCIADGDTGYGNAVNVKRTVFGYGRAVRQYKKDFVYKSIDTGIILRNPIQLVTYKGIIMRIVIAVSTLTSRLYYYYKSISYLLVIFFDLVRFVFSQLHMTYPIFYLRMNYITTI